MFVYLIQLDNSTTGNLEKHKNAILIGTDTLRASGDTVLKKGNNNNKKKENGKRFCKIEMEKNAKNLFTLLIEIGKEEKKLQARRKRETEKISRVVDINLLFIYQCLLRFLCVILHLSDVPSSFTGVIWQQ